MPMGGVAPNGSTLSNIDSGSIGAPFGADGSIIVGGSPLPAGRFTGLIKDGVLRAVTFGNARVEGVTNSITNFAIIHDVLPDGRVTMSNFQGGGTGAWLVNPDGTGNDIVSPTTLLPGFGDVVSRGECWPFVTADGRIYVTVSRVRETVDGPFLSALYRYQDSQLRLIIRSGDPRLRRPEGFDGFAFGAPGAETYFASGGRFACMADGVGLTLGHDSGVIKVLWALEAAPAVLQQFGVNFGEGFGVRGEAFRFSPGENYTDALSGQSRMAADGSIAFHVSTFEGRRRTFVVSARLNLCPPDVNEDGFVDFFDYGAFVDCFESGQGCGRFNVGDFNQDGFTDFFDYAAFVEAFEVGR